MSPGRRCAGCAAARSSSRKFSHACDLASRAGSMPRRCSPTARRAHIPSMWFASATASPHPSVPGRSTEATAGLPLRAARVDAVERARLRPPAAVSHMCRQRARAHTLVPRTPPAGVPSVCERPPVGAVEADKRGAVLCSQWFGVASALAWSSGDAAGGHTVQRPDQAPTRVAMTLVPDLLSRTNPTTDPRRRHAAQVRCGSD